MVSKSGIMLNAIVVAVLEGNAWHIKVEVEREYARAARHKTQFKSGQNIT